VKYGVGLAVGVGFGAVGRTQSATFESARNLAIGIGIQNFPEVSTKFSFFYK
jgi:zinc transporter 11